MSPTPLASPLSSPHDPSYFATQSFPEIIPQRSPTILRPSSISSTDTYPSEIDSVLGRSHNEAARYLAQFKSPSTSPEQSRRPTFRRAHTSSHPPPPFLSHTPSSINSFSSSHSSQRHLPSRTNPFGPPLSHRSVDLVTPVTPPCHLNPDDSSLRSSASTGTAFRVAHGQISYGKHTFTPTSPSGGSLQQLFRHDDMRRDPASLPYRQ